MPQARHHTFGAITLIPLLLNLLVAGQINLFRQWRPATHPCVDLLRLAVAGQRLQPVDVVAIHDPWLWVGMRRDSRGNGGLGSGDLLYRAAVDHPVFDSVVGEAMWPYSGRLRLNGTALAELVVQRRLNAQGFRLSGKGTAITRWLA